MSVGSDNSSVHLPKKRMRLADDGQVALALPDVSAKSWLVADVTNGEVIASHYPDLPLQIASLCKVACALVVVSEVEEGAVTGSLGFEDLVCVSVAAAKEKGGFHADLCEGDQLTVFDLLHALLLPSGCDAAIALAEVFGATVRVSGDGKALPEGEYYAGGWQADSNVEKFVRAMNEMAKKCGCLSTNFVNPHGLGCDIPDHRSTARDVLLLVRAAWQYKVFREIVQTQYHSLVVGGPQRRTLKWTNTNILLWNSQFKFLGVKTGMIPVRRCNSEYILAHLLTAVRRRDHDNETEIFVIVLGSSSKEARFEDTERLCSWVFSTREE